MKRSTSFVAAVLLASACTSSGPEASIDAAGLIGCADQAAWGRVIKVDDDRATLRVERWLVPAAGGATVEVGAASTGPVQTHGMLVIEGESVAWLSDEAGRDAENAWERAGRPRTDNCADNPQG